MESLNFCASSAGAFVLDNALFTLVLYVASDCFAWRRAASIGVAFAVARATSATCNFFYNKAAVFRFHGCGGGAFAKYWALALAVLGAGSVSTELLSWAFDARGGAITGLKMLVEAGLFLVSFQLQRGWVFGGGIAFKTRALARKGAK